MTEIVPLGKRVVIRPKDTPDQIGGIHIPDSAKEEAPEEGRVVAVGSDTRRVAEGNYVLFGQFAGTEIEREGETIVICYEEDILAVLVDE